MILFGRTILLGFITIDDLERVMIGLEVDLFPDQFLKVVLYVGELGLHVLEEALAGVVIFDVGGRPSPIRLDAHRKGILVKRRTLL